MFRFVSKYNITSDSTTAVCLYPISGQYLALPRFLYYALLLFSVFAHRRVWLVTGAVASFMTFSGTASIHAIILAVVSKNSLPDLDIFAVWAIVSSGCLITLPAMEFSKTLRESPARPVFKFWGLLVMIGAVCSAVACLRTYPEEPACWSDEGVLLSGQSETGRFNCTYSCFLSAQTLRAPDEITVVMKKNLLGLRGRLLVGSLIFAYVFAFIGFLSFLGAGRRRTQAELMKDIEEIEKTLRTPISNSTRMMAARGGTSPSAHRSQLREEKERMEHEIRTGEHKRHPYLKAIGVLSIVFFIVVVCFNEVCMFIGGGLPIGEPAYAVGQWSGWVSTILVLVASAILQAYLPSWENRQEIFMREQAAREATEKEVSRGSNTNGLVEAGKTTQSPLHELILTTPSPTAQP